jgi:hypothetical protein
MLTKKVFQIGMAPFAQSFLTAAGFDLSVWNASVGSQVPPPPPSSAPLAERVEWLFGRSIGGEEKRLFGAILYLKPNICQDGLGTNVGKALKQEVRFYI